MFPDCCLEQKKRRIMQVSHVHASVNLQVLHVHVHVHCDCVYVCTLCALWAGPG